MRGACLVRGAANKAILRGKNDRCHGLERIDVMKDCIERLKLENA